MSGATLKIEGARFVITVDPERRIIRDGSIVIDGQRVAHIGKASELQDVAADRVMDASEMVVTPGFCNARASNLRRDGPWCDGTYGLPLFFSASFPS